MKRSLIYLYTALLVWASGCQRQEIESPDLFLAYIPISIDWSESNMPDGYVANVTSYFYPKSGGSPYKQISGDIGLVVMELPIGEYSVLIINDVVGNVGGVEYSDENSFSDFRVEAIESGDSSGIYYTPDDDDNLITEHDRVSSWSLDSFEVTIDMVEYTRSDEFSRVLAEVRSGVSLSSALLGTRSSEGSDVVTTKALETFLNIQPQPVTSVVNLNIKINNIDNAQKIQGVFKGTASGVYLSSREESTHKGGTNVYPFTVTSVTTESTRSDDTSTTGYASYSLNTMGRSVDVDSGDESYELQLDVILNTGVLKSYVIDVTDDMLNSETTVNGELEVNITDDDEAIDLPVATEEGFGVSGWESTENLILR